MACVVDGVPVKECSTVSVGAAEALPAAATASAAQRAANPRAKWGNLLLLLLHCMTTSLENVGRILLFVIISKSRAIDPSSTKPMLADGYTMRWKEFCKLRKE